ncbi:hypothetical protein CONPUDRAFT_155613 [Coniophora puteana RWD-64-598 SS2]|uniref:Uncharacterized protein n=1 Tax=Coniophora puteana (strain RWD-64-598) TaxID=741705 RepID=A0A5M3MJ11_CONPW|nr:uncharacterized protein CONPUDRAFT_155613 [Coniophora puteana RWD-64-598 SS2]EIW78910.1 hypothetical protein CONPUDRAFT_155613 [Coniophora puteana RWD-64-598 SS2]
MSKGLSTTLPVRMHAQDEASHSGGKHSHPRQPTEPTHPMHPRVRWQGHPCQGMQTFLDSRLRAELRQLELTRPHLFTVHDPTSSAEFPGKCS